MVFVFALYSVVTFSIQKFGHNLSGTPFWPAKVMRVLNGECDVRFFGGFHQRALVEKSQVKPIDTR